METIKIASIDSEYELEVSPEGVLLTDPETGDMGPFKDAKVKTFGEALKALNIEDYQKRIFDSNSRGELFHLMDYVQLANVLSSNSEAVKGFREWFVAVVDSAEKSWKRPESVFQHILAIFNGALERGQ